MHTPDILIIGGGIVGAASAFFCSRAGLKATILEKREALGLLTTSASLAAFRAQFAEPENIAMMRESIAFFENIRAETGVPDADIGLTQQGYLFCTTTEAGAANARKRVALQQSYGLTDVELWDGDETRRHFPFISPDVIAATFRARDGWLSPNDLTNLYARASGAQIIYETFVTDLICQGAQLLGVKTNRGEYHAPIVILAAGPFTRQFALRYGLDLPITLIRRQHAAIKENARIPHHAPMTIDADTGAHWRPEGRGAILAVNTDEPPSEPLEHVQPDWEFPALALDAVTRITPFWDEVAQNLRKGDIDVRAGQYDMTPDAKPIIDAHPEIRGLYVHCGYSGHGVMGSAAGSRILSDLITGKQSRTENPFGLARFENMDLRALEKLVL
ncbi:MAG TPA: FAD-binding oxidoreductase [Anaerolineae bacterium]|nr:FAD-binding oxidoreductase [Anaerolineae bacterium]